MPWLEGTRVVEAVSGVVIAVLGVLGTLLRGRTASATRRTAIKDDLEILRALDREGAAHRALAEHVDRRVHDLVRFESHARRDANGVAAGALLVATALWAAGLSLNGGWWRLLLVVSPVVLAVGIYGIAVSLPKKVRDAKGNPVAEVPDGG